MLGAVIKSFYAEKNGIDPADIYSVSIMPCTAKKFEAARPEMMCGGSPDIDAVATTRELGRMFRGRGIDISRLAPESADSPFGHRSTAGKLFGATGGVMEAAVRTAYHLLTGRELGKLELSDLRGLNGIKEARIDIGGFEIGVAVASGLANARTLLEQIKAGRTDLHFIEVMTCPGGCIAGGGQPYNTDMDAVRKRMHTLYSIDKHEPVRTSHSNSDIWRLYSEFLGEPLGEKSHHLLHTSYARRQRGY
jgi:iron only hydrogenase large subunit-like protein